MQALPQFVAISFFPEAEPGLYQPHVCFFIHQNRKHSVEQWGFICKAERGKMGFIESIYSEEKLCKYLFKCQNNNLLFQEVELLEHLCLLF